MTIDNSNINKLVAEYDFVKKMRASVFVLGPLLTRFGEAKVSLPGGCAIGVRPVDFHLRGLEAMDAKIDIVDGYIVAKAPEGGLKGADFTLPMASVSATENLMSAAVLANGTTILRNVAKEPHIVAMADFLNKCGADISGAGTDTLTIHGVKELGGCEYIVPEDYIEAGTYAIAAAITDGDVLLKNCNMKTFESYADVFEKVGIEPPKGILLYGPPGTGKTLLAKAVANETNATFIKVVASEFVKKYIGEGARLVREVFELAKEKAPAIIFIDELDAVAAKRLKSSTSGDREVQRTLMQLLAELDGFESRGDIGIVGATNRPDILDPALLRPGRFDRFIEVPLPNDEGRKEILKIHTKNMSFDEEADIDLLASLTDGLSGADLKAVCTEAGMFAIRQERDVITVDDFMDAIEKVMNKNKEDELFNSEAGVMFG
jgi:proteasome regulatory subunit